jgi:OOP family OmpA-OmpF porin
MACLRRTVSNPSCTALLALALAGGVSLYAVPGAAAPDDDEEIVDDEEDAGSGEEEEEEDSEEAPTDDEEAPRASGRASVSLGGEASAEGKAKRGKGKKAKGEKAPKKKDDRPFFLRYRPTNHMLNIGGYLGGFFLARNYGLFDNSVAMTAPINRSAFDLGFRAEYMPIPWVGAGLEIGGMPTQGQADPPSVQQVRAGFYTVRGHVIGSLPYRLTPTIAIGAGLLGLRSRNADILNGGDAAFHWGPGLKFHINEWVAVRLDGRHIVTGPGTDSRRSHHGELLVGAEVTLRLTKWAFKKYRAERSDRDGDTVADLYDDCPDEPGDDENGCPRNRDSDGDGIKDKSDKCPKEWGDGVDGCPIPDKDSDSILDDDDSCVDEAEVFNGIDDTDGCPDELPEEVKKFEGVIQGILFDTGKSTIRKKSKPVLVKVVDLLKKYPQLRVEISGHTDNVGKDEDNVKLSQARADAVKAWLVEKGIEESRITTRGAGPNEPIADNKTKKGRSKNRRIEFKVL